MWVGIVRVARVSTFMFKNMAIYKFVPCIRRRVGTLLLREGRKENIDQVASLVVLRFLVSPFPPPPKVTKCHSVHLLNLQATICNHTCNTAELALLRGYLTWTTFATLSLSLFKVASNRMQSVCNSAESALLRGYLTFWTTFVPSLSPYPLFWVKYLAGPRRPTRYALSLIQRIAVVFVC